MNTLTIFLMIVFFLFNLYFISMLVWYGVKKQIKWNVAFIILAVLLLYADFSMSWILESSLYQGPENIDSWEIMGAIIMRWGLPAIFVYTSIETLLNEAKVVGIQFLRNLLYSASFIAGLMYYSYWSIIIFQFILKTNELPH